MPVNTKSVTRPSIWGNPFETAEEYKSAWDGFNGHSELYQWFKAHGWHGGIDKSDVRFYLKGKNLACWCAPDQSCHADVLLEIANAEEA